MVYVFDTSSLREASHISPTTFLTFWEHFNDHVKEGVVLSVREVRNELNRQNTKEHLEKWTKQHSDMFLVPTAEEMLFVRDIFAVPRFQKMVRQKQLLRGWPVADPFVIAAAAVAENGCVVTEETRKKGSVQIPNVCEHFKVDWTNFQGFLEREGWEY